MGATPEPRPCVCCGARLPAGWQPDFIALWLPYAAVPACLWSAPVPLVGLAGDWNLLWHHYRRRLPCCDLLLTDAAGVAALARAGVGHARPACLYGCERDFLEAAWPDGPRDIDVLFVGNLHPAVQRERMPWLARLAALGERWNVAVRTGVFGDDYRALLSRAKVVFNRSIRGEADLHTFEAAAAGAVLFAERRNLEVPAFFRDREECVLYGDDLETLLDHYLTHEDERSRLAEAARLRVRAYSFAALWDQALERAAGEWTAVRERAARRPVLDGVDGLLARTWERLCSSYGDDPSLPRDLAAAVAEGPRAAALANARGLLGPAGTGGQGAAMDARRAAEHFRLALASDPWHPVAALNLAEALTGAGLKDLAVDACRRALSLVRRSRDFPPEALDAARFPTTFDHFRVEWERAAQVNAGNPAAEREAKRELLRWRLHMLLADLTGDMVHFHEAALARPDLPVTRAMLGCALGRAGRPGEAVPHLRLAATGNPFDAGAAKALFQALGDAGDSEGAERVARQRRLLRQAAPQAVAAQAWFTLPPGGAPPHATPQPGPVSTDRDGQSRQRVSLCMIVKDEEHNLPACLAGVADLVDEIVVVDTGSTDRTKDVAVRFGARVFDFPWRDDFAAARNESLRHATGDWVFWMDADDRLDQENREKLRALFAALRDENAAYSLKCLCLPDRRTGGATVVDHVRLFRNRPDVRWEHRVHEQILPALRRSGADVRWAEVVVHHAGYQDPALRARKLERDLRLLHIELGERPDHPFTLFNLGSVQLELGRPAEALALLRRSLEKSHPQDSIVRKLYALIVGCHRLQNQRPEALAACQEGRHVCPDDPELLFLEGLLRRERGDLAGAEACLLQVLETKPGPHFASVDAGLRGYKARHNLAVVHHQQGRAAQAEAQWRRVVQERPDFVPGWLGLGECALKRGDWSLLETAARRLDGLPGGPLEAALLRGRGLLARREFAAARAALEAAIAHFPQELAPRVVLTYVLLQEGRDVDAAEKALRAVLALAPNHVEAQRNLDLLLARRREQQERAADAVFAGDGAPPSEHQAAAPGAAEGVEQPLILSAKGEEGRPAAASVRFAVVCVAHDEEVVIDAFLDHYLGHGAEAAFVVDNESTDATAERARRRPNVTVERLASGELDEELRTATFQRMREACAGKFDWVLLVDCDEFLVPKRGGTLKEALAAHAGAALLGTDGWDVVQRAGDRPVDWGKPLLAQRGWGVPNARYDKPVVLRPAGPERLVPGQHYLVGPEPRPSLRPFWLLHFAACDERLFFQRRLKMTARQGLKNIQKAYSIEHTAQTEADVRRRWRSLQNDPRMAPLPTMRDGTEAGAAP